MAGIRLDFRFGAFLMSMGIAMLIATLCYKCNITRNMDMDFFGCGLRFTSSNDRADFMLYEHLGV